MKLVFGCGYLGSRVAALWLAQGNEVAVVTRSAERAIKLRSAGYSPIIADVTDSASLDGVRPLSTVKTVLYAVGFDAASGKSRRQVYVEGLHNALNALRDGVRRFIYISTTSVYGQNDGSWIDEESPCQPIGEGGRVYVEAEAVLRDHALARHAIILRLAGLYGPGRIPRRDELLSGKPLSADADAYLNLIHVDDAARIVLAVESQISPPGIYLVSDGCPVVRRDYYAEAARLLGAPQPVFAESHPGTSSGMRGNTNKRVNNTRLTSEIAFRFQYPTYQHGLASIVTDGTTP